MPNLTCSIDECDKPLHNKANGWCEKHYYRNYRYGSPFGFAEKVKRERTLDLASQFQHYIAVSSSGCHEWQGGKLKGGYGCYRSRPAHRWVWTQTHGPIPSGQVVRHKCDNPPCVNLEHLELGTVRQNQEDMVERGRSLKGSKNAIAKLDEGKVLEIKIAVRDKTSTQLELAGKYGVTPPCINSVILGRTWKHVTIEAA